MIVSAGRGRHRAWKKNWRVHERDACERYFGEIKEVEFESDWDEESEYVRWHPDPELTTKDEWTRACDKRHKLSEQGVKFINDVLFFDNVQCKDHAFNEWRIYGISCPLESTVMPYIYRINDGVACSDTYLVEDNMSDIYTFPTDTDRIDTKPINVQYIDTRWRRHHTSFRFHVAGKNVISGYARISDDWKCITSGFREKDKQDWVDAQKLCAERVR